MSLLSSIRLRVYLYHIPPVAGVPISHTLIEWLLKAYPKTVAGIKDSSGDWEHTQSLITHFGKRPGQREEDAGDFLRVFAGAVMESDGSHRPTYFNRWSLNCSIRVNQSTNRTAQITHRERGLPAADAARGRSGLHLRHRQRQPARHPRGTGIGHHGWIELEPNLFKVSTASTTSSRTSPPQLYRQHEAAQAEVLQERCNAVRDRFASTGQMIPAMKAAVAHFTGDKEWELVRPPLVELGAEQKRRLLDGLVRMGFQMPGLRGGAAGDR